MKEEETLSRPDKKYHERVYNYKITSEEIREIEVKGILFTAKFYKTTAKTSGIRIPLRENGPLFDKFYEYCLEIKDQRVSTEKEKGLISFATFGALDQGLDFFPVMGFYVYPFEIKGKEPHLIFNEEKAAPSPIKRLEAFVDYYRKKFDIKVSPKKSSFERLKNLDLTEI